jgi:5-methylcytosine-specific restriction endonuclease McrA
MCPLNPRVTKRERGLLKGAINRVFSRSELRQQALDRVTIEHFDSKRPRVTKWAYCESCGVVTPRYLLDVDHKSPRVPLHSSFDQLSLDEYVDRTWCELDNLQCLDENCHNSKSSVEKKLRKYNKEKNKE